MSSTIGQLHREKILSFVPPGGRMLQWGSGDHTIWFAQHLPPGATLTAVEHDPAVHARVARETALPLIVSYYTEGTAYEDEARQMMESCDRLGLEYDVAAMPNLDCWDANVAQKTEACLAAWLRHGRPILWVDADATLLERPSLLAGSLADVGIHRWSNWQLAGGTLFFNQTPLGERVLRRWLERCRREPQVLDQVSLDLTWEEITASAPLDTLWLPRRYYQIFDKDPDADEPTVILHGQASRRLKHVVSTKRPSRPHARPSQALYRARLASRPRRWLLAAADAEDFDVQVAEERGRDALLMAGHALGPTARPAGARAEGWWIHTTPEREPRARVKAEQAIVEACLHEIDAELQQVRETLIAERLTELVSARMPVRCAIYGAGEVGQALLRALRTQGIEPVCFVQTAPKRSSDASSSSSASPEMLRGLPILSPAECLAAGCHLYVIGSFGSTGPMLATLDEIYASRALHYEALLPTRPSPRLPDVTRAAKTLHALGAGLATGRSIAEIGLP
jgi:hypothetical protein